MKQLSIRIEDKTLDALNDIKDKLRYNLSYNQLINDILFNALIQGSYKERTDITEL